MRLEQFEALGFINERGVLEMNDRKSMIGAMSQFPRGASVVVSVKVARERRSNQQSRYWHGVVIPIFADHCGNTHEEMKDALALELIPKEVTDIKTGEIVKVPGHTSELNTKEFNELVEKYNKLAKSR